MPNWCMTNYVFHGNETEIKDFHQKITEYTSTNLVPNGFGKHWLGNVLAGVGLKNTIDHPEESVHLRCRGSIEYISDVEELSEEGKFSFFIDTETAWTPMVKMWVEVIKALKYETVKFSFIAEEPGMEIYDIYDPEGFFEETHCVDVYLDGEDEYNKDLELFRDERYYQSEEGLRYSLQQLLNTDEEDLSVLIDKVEHYDFKNENSCIVINEYTRHENLEDFI